MADSFQITELVDIFRSGLIALLPVMDRAQIAWQAPRAYDPWEEIERTLYSSIIGSCIENSTPLRLPEAAPYGLQLESYSARTFLGDADLRRSGTPNIFLEFATVDAPFDTALFQELDQKLVPIGEKITRFVGETRFELVWHSLEGLRYSDQIFYQD